MQPTGYRVTLVHGTFARGASWTQDGSVLRSALAQQLDLPTHFSVFEWTGNNDHGARLEAARELQSFMRKLIQDNPSDLHFIVAHSHGGNIVLHALKDARIRENVSGVMTMGTPFISCQHREIDQALSLLKYAVPAVAFLVICTIIGLSAVPLITYLGNRYGVGGFCLGFGIPMVIGFALYKSLFEHFRDFVRYDAIDWAKKHQVAISDILNVEGFTKPPFFCAVVNQDEAGRWLTSLQSISNAPGWSFFVVLQLWRKTRWWLVGLFAITLVLSVTANLPDAVSQAFMVAGTGIMAAAVVLQLSMLLLPKLVRAHKYGFGGETFYDNWLNNITVSESPIGILANIRRFEVEQGSISGLRHSMFYENKTCLVEMAAWIKRVRD